MQELKADIFFWTRHGEYGYCSNFYRADIDIDGTIYPTVEHYYQSQKTLDVGERAMIMECWTPKEAKFAGYHVKLRSDWEDMKDFVMLKGLWTKFTQHEGLKEKLLATGNATLHENSPWDKYWGYARGKGLDMLGRLLMQVRADLVRE